MSDSSNSVVLGLWPIAGITTVGVTEREARATIGKAIDCGITAFDTAYSYGFDGESDRLLGDHIRQDRDRFLVIGKVGQRWDDNRVRVVDASPDTLRQDAESSLRRIGIEHFDLLMLHSPDPNIPLEQSVDAIVQLQSRGLCRNIGVCNVNLKQYRFFRESLLSRDLHCDAIQCPLNLLQRDALADLIPQCESDRCGVDVYWTLMKGLLAGRIGRNHVFEQGDSRPGYPIFQGKARQRAHDVIDALRHIGNARGCTVAQLAIGWALAQPGVRSALVGARRPEQVVEIAAARKLPTDVVAQIDEIVSGQR